MGDYQPKIQNKVAIVTGAASGFGKLLAERLVEYKAKVFLVDINPDIEQVSQVLNQRQPGSTHWAVCDLCQIGTISSVFSQAVEHFGQVDILVNNAGIANHRSLFSQPDHTELERIIHLNLIAPMEATRLAVRYFKESNIKGVVVNTASVGGLLPISIMESYGTTKAGLIFFTTTCKHLAPQIRVNAVAPYFADTPLVENNRMVKSFPLVHQMGLMSPNKVVWTMLKAICDESLAGDTLMVAMGAKPKRLTFYNDLTLHVTSYIANGTVNKYGSLISALFSRVLDNTLGFIRKKLPYSDE